MVTSDVVQVVSELSSRQEEADTKVVLHAKHALEEEDQGMVIIRSHSGDTDIAVIALGDFIPPIGLISFKYTIFY